MASTKPAHRPKHRPKPHTQPQTQLKQTTWVKHHKKRNYAITAAIVSALLIIIVIASLPHPSASVGNRAPDFALQDVNTRANFHLNDMMGRPMMIEFMRTQCEWCLKEAPILAQLFQNHTSIIFVSISIDPAGDQPNVLQSYAMGHQSMGSMMHPWYWLRDSMSTIVTGEYGVTGTPTMFMIDSHGIVQARLDGYKDTLTVQQALQTIA